jgi:hypothetical protein
MRVYKVRLSAMLLLLIATKSWDLLWHQFMNFGTGLMKMFRLVHNLKCGTQTDSIVIT